MTRSWITFVAATCLFLPTVAFTAITPAKAKPVTSPAPSLSMERQFSTAGVLGDGSVVETTVIATGSEEKRAQTAMSEAIGIGSAVETELSGIAEKLATLPAGTSLTLSPAAFTFFEQAVLMAGQTNGWFDIMGPTHASIFVARDWRRVLLDKAKNQIAFKDANVKLDVARSARGYAVDVILEELGRQGFVNAKVVAGPVMRVTGRDLHTPWTVRVEVGKESSYARRSYDYNLAAGGVAVVTSDGLASGLIDPKNKKPVPAKWVRTVTVMATSAMRAVAYGLASYTLGPKVGFRFIEAHPEVKGVLVDNSGTLFAAPGLIPGVAVEDGGAIAAKPQAEVQGDRGPADANMKLKETEEARDE